MADEKLANAKIFFTLSLSRMFYCFVFDDHFCFQHFISVSLMTNRAGLKLLQNLNKSPPCLNRTGGTQNPWISLRPPTIQSRQ